MEEEKLFMPRDNLRLRLIRAMESYPREHSRHSPSTPENSQSLQGASSHHLFGSVFSQQVSQQPIILRRTTHPSGVVPRPANVLEQPLGSANGNSFVL